MFDVLRNRTYRYLFFAQLVALTGTGLATMALGLLAYDLAGGGAGAVLGFIFTIKMVAYVTISPLAGAFANFVSRRKLLVTLDCIRAAMALGLPFVSEVWQVYVMVFLMQSASAAFTPVFQATIPDVLVDEESYTKALSLSRLIYDLENIVSPFLAAVLLALVAYNSLFFGTVIGFAASAAFLLSVGLPKQVKPESEKMYERLTAGVRIFLATPRLRGLMAVNFAVASAGAMILVNTVVLVQGELGLGEQQTVVAMGAFGFGSVLAALMMPAVLEQVSDRAVMLSGSLVMFAMMLLTSLVSGYLMLLVIWFVAGFGYACAQVPSGRLLRRSAHEQDRPPLFSSQFALSHACWLVTYPLAGALGLVLGLSHTAIVLGILAGFATVLAALLWPAGGKREFVHDHADLPEDHPHLQVGEKLGAHRHRHNIIIDPLHPQWPTLR